MLPESDSTPNDNNAQEAAPTSEPAVTPTPSTFSVTPEPVASAPVSTPAPTVPDADTYDSTALSLYIITAFSGASVLGSASYLAWTVADYFAKPAPEFSFFDLSSFTIYALIYLVLFTTLYALASLRLDKRIKQAGTFGRPLSTVSAIWRAILVIWGVVAFIGLLYSPLSAATEGDFSSLASEITSAVVSLVFVGLVFWRDLFVPKMRSGMVALGAIAGLALLVAGANAYATFNPKQSEEDPYDYSSRMYDDFESSSSSSTTEIDFEDYGDSN